MATTTLVITHGTEQLGTIQNRLKRQSGTLNACNVLAKFFRGLAGGVYSGKFVIGVGSGSAVSAVGTVAPAQASITAGDILYVGSIGFVATNGAVTPGDATFDMRTDTASVCTSIAAQVNAHATLTGVVSASATATTVTITAKLPGTVGNHITLAKVNVANAAFVLNGLANTVLQSTLLAGTGAFDASPFTVRAGV